VRGATLQILATCPVVKIVFHGRLSRLFLSNRAEGCGPSERRLYHVGRHSMPSGSSWRTTVFWVEAILGFRKTAVGFVASAVCRTYIGGDRAGRRTTFGIPLERRCLPSSRGPHWRSRESGGRTAPEGGTKWPEQRLPRTQCVECLLKWRFPPFRQLKLPIFEGTVRSAWMHSFFYSSSNRLMYFFDPRMVLTLGSLARTTVAPWEFVKSGFSAPVAANPQKPR